ncbi:MFS transporter [Herbiconiux moechotypicola]|uniref:MFS transporter n=1 Tax=Herbiconiux moechotypicola TaxID=637393 RepID=A0ABP5QFA7_9MICO|nr:MFS transporter [Herbiconiux moechotypicola]MCS5729741.1 MFS transporter [Herbiconiux moechotypicola]
MVIRRAFFSWQFPAAVILPAWILVGWGVFAATGWQIIGLIVGVMMLTVAMLATAGIVFARKDVRAERAVSWLDAGLLTVLHGLVIAVGFFTPVTALLSTLVVVAVLALFWAGIVQLVMETRRRVREAVARFEEQARVPQQRRSPRIDGEYIVIQPSSVTREEQPPRL